MSNKRKTKVWLIGIDDQKIAVRAGRLGVECDCEGRDWVAMYDDDLPDPKAKFLCDGVRFYTEVPWWRFWL